MKKALLLGIAGSFFFAFYFSFKPQYESIRRKLDMERQPPVSVYASPSGASRPPPVSAETCTQDHPEKSGVLASMEHRRIRSVLCPPHLCRRLRRIMLIAASWQMTIVMGLLLSPFFRQRIPFMNLLASALILLGVFLLQFHRLSGTDLRLTLFTLLPILIAAISYPLGNRKMMALENTGLSTLDRTYGMTLCSLPFWIMLSVWGLFQEACLLQARLFSPFL